jgi:hypothetical protein
VCIHCVFVCVFVCTSHRKLETLIKEAIECKELNEEFECELREYLESANTAELPKLFPYPAKEVTKRIASAKKETEALSGAREEISGDAKKHEGGGGAGGGAGMLLLQLHLPLRHLPSVRLPNMFNRGCRLRKNY